MPLARLLWLVAVPVAAQRHYGDTGYYWGVFAAAGVSWIGLPGPGEASLIAAGVLAYHHHIHLWGAILAAFAGAALGGLLGWAIGHRLGHPILIRKTGRFRRAREAILRRGQRLFAKWGIVAVYFSPSWLPGMMKMSLGRFLVANVISAAVWATWIGIAAFLIGPPVARLASDVGEVGAIAIGVLIVGGVALEVWLHRRRRARA